MYRFKHHHHQIGSDLRTLAHETKEVTIVVASIERHMEASSVCSHPSAFKMLEEPLQ